MKTRFLTIILLFFVSACRSTDSVPFLKFEGIKGNIMSVKESHYEAESKFGDIFPGDLSYVIKKEYDSEGHNTLFAHYNEDGESVYEAKNIFSKGEWIETTTKSSYSNSKTKQTVIERKKNYTKIEVVEGKDTSIFEIKASGLISKTYNDKGIVICDISYNTIGQVLEQRNFDDDGNITFRIVNEFDNDGLPSKTISYYSTWDDVQTFTYKDFDKKGNWTTQIVYSDDEPVSLVKREIIYR